MPSTREKLHASLRKLRDVYRAGVKRGRYKAEIAEYNARLGLRADVRDFEKARKQTDCDVEEYFGFEFYKKDEAGRDAYLTRVRRTKLIRKMGDVDEGLTIPGNKVLFNTLFGEYLRRAWISPTAATEEAFVGFVQHPGSFPERVGISFGVAGRPVDQIEAVGGHFPFARRCSLGDQRGGRCGVSVTARGDFTIEVPQCVVDQQGVVHIPAR